MGRVKVGCCGFPVSRAKYYRDFSLVEVQQTFYQPPQMSTLNKWADEAPEGFEFTVKAWQVITHPCSSPTYRRLKKGPGRAENYGFFRNTPEVAEAWDRTLEAVQVLRARLILFQTPPRFNPSENNILNMKSFFAKTKKDNLVFLFEPRGWPWQKTLEVCRLIGLVPVVTEKVLEGPLPDRLLYIRLHGRQNYRYKYTKDDLTGLKSIVESFQGPVYVLFNNLHMYEDALRFKEMVE